MIFLTKINDYFNELTRWCVKAFYSVTFRRNGTQIIDFFNLLESQDADSTFVADPNQPDPLYHEMVFYDKDGLARKFQLDFDNNQWVWYPWDREVLPDAIGSYVEP